jgi:hypothetical protein
MLTLKLFMSKDFSLITSDPALSTTTSWCIAMGIWFLGTCAAEVGGVVGLYVGAGVAPHSTPITTTMYTTLLIDGNIALALKCKLPDIAPFLSRTMRVPGVPHCYTQHCIVLS